MRGYTRAQIIRATGKSRGSLYDLELRGIIPDPPRNEKGWVIYQEPQLHALINHYQKRGIPAPEKLIELLEALEVSSDDEMD